MANPEPIFPPEIEYIIFTDALPSTRSIDYYDHYCILNLLLVAKRVHTWLIPRLMRTIGIQTIGTSRTYPKGLTLNSDTLQKYGIYVRNLFVSTFESSETHLPLCPNITNLFIWTDNNISYEDLIPLAKLPLTHLSINFDYIPDREISQSDTPYLELKSLFSSITHLEVLCAAESDGYRTYLPYFTSITHLAIVHDTYRLDIPLTFKNHPTLQVMVFEENGGYLGIVDAKEFDDPRVVRVSFGGGQDMEEWALEVDEGKGIWSLVDNVLRERAKREGVRRH